MEPTKFDRSLSIARDDLLNSASSSVFYASGMQKRDREGDTNDFLVPPNKRQNVAINFVPEIPPVLSEDESVHSMQGWETELCRDTPDTSTDSEDSPKRSPDSFLSSEVEYELESLSEAEKPFGISSGGSSDTSSEDKDCCVKVTEIVVKVDEEEFWGDDSHTDKSNATSEDQEIPSSDFWTCLRCRCINKPLPRYCKRCFQVRKNWFPPRPRRKREKRKVRKRSQNMSRELTDSGLGSFSKKDDEITDIAIPTTSAFCDKPKPNSENTKASASALGVDKCITCMEGPKNTAFVHGNVGHICCCYKCAKTVWSRSGKCPVCNRKSNRVIKVFFA